LLLFAWWLSTLFVGGMPASSESGAQQPEGSQPRTKPA
jgi:hypothetical protein